MTPGSPGASGKRSSRTGERLRRLLAIVPYVLRHPGTELAELSSAFGVDREELVRDLNVLLVSGVPPFYPHQMVDVEVDEERVWISAADHLSDPVRLTRDEALALYLQGKALLGAPGLAESGDLASALGKLEAALQESLGGLAGGVEVPAEGREAERERGVLDAVRRAVAGRERLAIRYYSASRDSVTDRRIDPEHVFAALGHWYVAAWDPDADGERLFRLDRIHRAVRTGKTFQPRNLAGAGRPLYSRTEADIPVRLRLGPEARWVAEYYEVEDETEREGSLEVTLPTKDLAWVAKLLLQLGGRAEVVDPPELAEMARRLAEETLAAYA